MKLVDIKSREKRPVTVQMTGHVPNRIGARVTRDVRVLDRVSGDMRVKRVTRKFPPVICWRPGETLTALAHEVLENSTVQSLVKRRRLVIVKEYDSPNEITPRSAPSVVETPKRKSTRRQNK